MVHFSLKLDLTAKEAEQVEQLLAENYDYAPEVQQVLTRIRRLLQFRREFSQWLSENQRKDGRTLLEYTIQFVLDRVKQRGYNEHLIADAQQFLQERFDGEDVRKLRARVDIEMGLYE